MPHLPRPHALHGRALPRRRGPPGGRHRRCLAHVRGAYFLHELGGVTYLDRYIVICTAGGRHRRCLAHVRGAFVLQWLGSVVQGYGSGRRPRAYLRRVCLTSVLRVLHRLESVVLEDAIVAHVRGAYVFLELGSLTWVCISLGLQLRMGSIVLEVPSLLPRACLWCVCFREKASTETHAVLWRGLGSPPRGVRPGVGLTPDGMIDQP